MERDEQLYPEQDEDEQANEQQLSRREMLEGATLPADPPPKRPADPEFQSIG